MTTIIRDSILVSLALFTTACVDYGPVNDGSESGSMDSGSDDPTGGSLLGTYFICYNGTNYQVNAGGVPFYFQAMNTCVVLEDPVNWMSPENQEKILNACSQVCQASYGGKNNHCVDSGWKGAEPVYENVLESTCDPDQYGGPEYGGGILWLDGVQSPDREVACDLHGTCGDLFGPDVAKQLKSGRTPDDGESSGAQQSIELHLSVESNTMSELRLDGNMDFTQVACGEPACPFYLGDADIVQAEGHWRIALDLGALGRVDKRLSNARIKLARPALGILLANGQLAFPAESLQFRVDAEITGAPHPFVENGEQSFWLANPTVVLGRLIDGALEMTWRFPPSSAPSISPPGAVESRSPPRALRACGWVSSPPSSMARVRRKFMLTVALCGSCESSDDAFLETTYVRYVTEQPFAPCGGLAADTDLKIEHLFDRIGEPYPSKRSITYKWVANNQSLVCLDYAAGCTRMEGEEPIVAALDLAQTHELAHATHFIALGWGNRLLAEGFATYLANQPPALSSESLSSFATDIELMITQGTVATEKQYALAAQFVGVTMERHGIEDFKDFWRNVDETTTLEAFRTAYETQYGEPWSQALSAIAAGQQSTYTDIGCRGEAQVVGAEGLSLTFAQTCEDDGVLGPVWRNGAIAGEVPIPVQLDEGLYRFSFTSEGAVDEPAAHFRGCHEGTTAPQVPVGLFFPGEDSVLFLGAGRYLLSVRVPLTQDDARDAIAMKITPQM